MVEALRLPGLPDAYDGVVFDLDGLVVDTEPIWLRAKHALFKSYNTAFEHADHLAVYGSSEAHTASYFAKRFGRQSGDEDSIRNDYLGLMADYVAEGVALREGSRELLDWLRVRVPVALASNTRRSLADQIVARAGLEGCFDAVATGDEAEPKPAPDIYLLACDRLGVEPGRSVAIEDSPSGVQAAKAAGMSCVAVPSEPGCDVSRADLVIRSLRDLMPAPLPAPRT